MKHIRPFYLAITVGLIVLAAGCGNKQEAQAEDHNKLVTDMALKSGGDINKLTPEEQKKLKEIVGDDAATVLQMHPSAQMGQSR